MSLLSAKARRRRYREVEVPVVVARLHAAHIEILPLGQHEEGGPQGDGVERPGPRTMGADRRRAPDVGEDDLAGPRERAPGASRSATRPAAESSILEYSARLEVMEERQVTSDGVSRPVPRP